MKPLNFLSDDHEASSESMATMLPDWKKDGAPLQTEVTHDEVLFLTATGTLRTPEWAIPPGMKNHGAYIGSAALMEYRP